ncbi:sigma-54 dependent transcriptional regulator [Massilia endophytica]|uniref:sigma-54 dependent transcriptional regulator n=1 Tax=Massilia endophytica TaxID=2899220 RepID=UPI001E3A6240|nr:sigma-54 dependent transcriptional regulator [Massilia endophytica]UGQ48263.1 sigma-54 dependent transcriptional regulator [Massilia endophytica]
MPTRRLLCVSAARRFRIEELGEGVGDFDVHLAAGLQDAVQYLRSHTPLVGLLVLDQAPPEAIDDFLHEYAQVKWIALLDEAALASPQCRQIVHEHCFDYHRWPIDAARLRHTLGHAYGVASLRPPPAHSCASSMRLTGPSRPIARLRQQIGKVAAAEAPVLIWGESGTGKELVAQAVHEHSARAAGPFVPINCGAMPANLIQSELFGYERGAFTGAARSKPGLIESASGGSLFLDEIGDLPLELQSNLLRFLQEKTIYRLGGTRCIPVDVRIIAASHVKLHEAVQRGAFREDLYYRLNVLALEVPPLRERGDDVVPLAEYFFQHYAAERAARVKGFSARAIAAMRAHHWPGNVRELLNRVRRAAVMAEGRLILAQDLGLDSGERPHNGECLDGARVRAERNALEARLSAGKSMTAIARELGVSRMTLYRLLAKHQIAPPSRRRADQDEHVGEL